MNRDTRTTKSAVYLIDEWYLHEARHPIPSGWDYDGRGEALHKNRVYWQRRFVLETDPERNAPVTLGRKFMPVRHGKAFFNHIFEIENGDGFFFEFYDEDDNALFNVTQKNGMFFCNDDSLDIPAPNGSHSFSVEFDMDKKTAVLCYGGKAVKTLAIDKNNAARFKTGYRADSHGRAILVGTTLSINYLVCDRNEVFENTDLYRTWKTEGNAKIYTCLYEGGAIYTNVIEATDGQNGKCCHDFEKTSKKIRFEVKYLSKNEDGENIKLSLISGGKECVTLCDNGTALATIDGKELRHHNPYVWQTLVLDADTQTQKASVMLNGKKCGSINFDAKADFFDAVSVCYAPKTDSTLKFTDVFVSEIQPEPDDYPKPPVLPERKSEYVTGMNICSLWRQGEHVGWDAISAFHDNITYLGFYDEGIPEVADWEIKWMSEHGLDCEFYCWYARFMDAPNTKTMLSAAIHDGHFKAKYGDYMKLALIWEAGASAHPQTVEQVEKYFIPYFEDYFFTDPRYLQIDGVAIMSLYNTERLAKDLGSFEAVKQVVEMLRASAKKCGYKDLAIITCGDPSEQRKYTGVDAVYAYGWGHFGYDPDYQKNRMESQMKTGLLHVVPTVSVGYNDVAWRIDRHPMITCENMGKVIKWFTDDLLPSYKDCGHEWQKKLMMFSTWNEYGEGTYICPANLNGFGYLNEMRKAVTVNGDSFESDRPSEASLDRIGYLQPKGRYYLSALQLVPKEVPTKVVSEIKFDTPDSVNKWCMTDKVDFSFVDGKLYGKCLGDDPKLAIKVDNLDAEKIDGIAIKFVSAPGTAPLNRENPEISPVEAFFATKEDPQFHHTKLIKPTANAEDKSLVFLTKDHPLWKGTLTDFRIDPTTAEGHFEIESIKFLTFDDGITRYDTFIGGYKYNSHYRTKCVDGNLHIIFEPLREAANLLRVYYEWDNDEQTLMLEAVDGTVSYWKMGTNKAVIGGKEILLKTPLEMYDGLPYLPLDEFCLATGASYNVTGNRIDIVTK